MARKEKAPKPTRGIYTAVGGRSKVFIDTGGFIALLEKSDEKHHEASACYSNIKKRTLFYATNMIISETYTWLRYHVGHQLAVKFLDVVEDAAREGDIRIIQVDESVEKEARHILRKYRDQDFSYVDATSFVVMDKFEIQDVFGGDSHYHVLGKNLVYNM